MLEESIMTLCPIALVASCRQCPAFKVCPGKSLIGDYKPDGQADTADKPSGKPADGEH